MKKMLALFFVLFLGSASTAAFAQAPENWWRIVTPATGGVDALVAALPQTAEQELAIPILVGIEPGSFKNNYGITYANGSVHQGEDIFAPRGAYVVSPTEAVVTRVDTAGAGGIAVYTANPGSETFYYAHLTAVGPTIHVGAQLEVGDLIGYVGNTGDAAGASTHLHFQIFKKDIGVIDPNPRLTKAFSEHERVLALNNIVARSDNPTLAASAIATLYPSFFATLSNAGRGALAPQFAIASGAAVAAASGQQGSAVLSQSASVPAQSALKEDDLTAFIPADEAKGAPALSQDLRIGARNDNVKKLQQYLIDRNTGTYAQTLASYGATGYFGTLTRAALIEFQRAHDISGSGFCGPITRAYIAAH